ncbi:MAG: sodium-dependent transporter [Erysipelotrichaceae bacterium]|nr:sodium-dependent transporter [Erysipelotrichaceae bacterium]MDY6035442.1 sodium-dependent transporter [Bulleidia sp.]
MERERFSSRLGFILLSAGCAIGLGNVWRFPYIVGQYGGAAFVLIYIACLILLGLPIIIMEYAVGRASQKSVALSFEKLEPKGSKWHIYKWFAIAGNYLLMMYYTTIAGWLLLYFFKTLKGDFIGLDTAGVASQFTGLMSQPFTMIIFMSITVVLCFGICSLGLKNGVEKVTSKMMMALLIIMIALGINSIFLKGGAAGLSFYLKPNFAAIQEVGIGRVIFAALGQSFFTLSIGIGAMAIFGSYIDKKRTLAGEAVHVLALDTVVAIMAGLIIFPACFAFGIEPSQGPSLIFVTLPNVFNHMFLGRLWGSLFFLFMSFAALSTVIAVFQNIVAFLTDLFPTSIKKSSVYNAIAIILLSLPCILGFNLLSNITPLGAGSNIMDLEDFIVSNNLLPLGSLIYLLFCTSRYGWGFDNFLNEANQGEGIRFPKAIRFYVSYIIPLLVLWIFIQGYISTFVH